MCALRVERCSASLCAQERRLDNKLFAGVLNDRLQLVVEEAVSISQ